MAWLLEVHYTYAIGERDGNQVEGRMVPAVSRPFDLLAGDRESLSGVFIQGSASHADKDVHRKSSTSPVG